MTQKQPNEQLVLISINALVGILLPVLAAARKQFMATQCKSTSN
jgi:hypothetical protein